MGSLIPRPALALSRVSPTAPRDCRATNAAETRGTVAVPKLSLCSTRTLTVAKTLGHSAWCCSVQPTLSRRATTSVCASASVSVPRSPSQSTAVVTW